MGKLMTKTDKQSEQVYQAIFNSRLQIDAR